MKKYFTVLGAIFIFLILAALNAVHAASPYFSEISKSYIEKDSRIFVSFNGLNFGNSKSPKEISFMAKILRNADMIIIQEVSTSHAGAQAVASLCDELKRTGSDWDYYVSDPTHESDSKERYGFLWKPSRVQVEPRRAALIDALKNFLVREPAKIDFRINNKVVTVFSFHLAPTDKHPEKEIEMMGGFSSKFILEKAIMAGDFNLGHKKLDKVFEKNLGYKHQIEGKTSLKSKYGKNKSYLANEYDNIYTRGIKVREAGILDFAPYFSDLKQARQISDHLPVFIVFTP